MEVLDHSLKSAWQFGQWVSESDDEV